MPRVESNTDSEYRVARYENIEKAQICIAKSDNGKTMWTRCKENPIISPDIDSWDGDACYKPSFLWNEEKNMWMLWYNGRKGTDEFIGLAEYNKRNLFEK